MTNTPASKDNTASAQREKALRTLEFDRVQELLAAQTTFEPARELALGLRPSYVRDEVARWQEETKDALRLMELRPNLAVSDAQDISSFVQSAILGGTIAGIDLMQVARTLGVIHSFQGTLLRYKDSLPVLSRFGDALGDFREIESAIRRTITAQGDVLDSASDVLRRVRSEEKVAHQRLNARLQEIVASTLGRQILQEPFITTRDGRYVLAVKAEMRGQVLGLIHDISSSGATVFMEPLATVELGNAWRELQLAERNEVERILRELAAQVGEQGEAILNGLDALAEIDLALAKARFGREVRGVLPKLLENATRETRVRLKQARHPLLRGNVVPISLELGEDFHALVISGPNTGGKTVALKTVGLLALMAQAGLPIPADEGSALCVFDGVFADIGDEQSIQQSLSTFSSHMGNIVQILHSVTSESMVLLDELGAGTDPLEGAALAKAVLSSLVRSGVAAVVTTHHSELKAFAHSMPGMENANVEFDPVTLGPTYHLVVGLPGRSNAIAIAESLGLPKEILDEARSSVGSTEAEVDALLRQIQQERRQAEGERAAAERERRELEETRAALSIKLEKWEAENRNTTSVRRAEVQVMAEEMKSQLRQVARRINSLAGEKGKKELAALHAQMNDVRRKLDAPKLNPPVPAPLKREERILPGQRILIEGVESTAEVLAGPDRRQMVEVQVGPVRMLIHQDRIKGRDRKPPPQQRKVFVSPEVNSRAQVGPELWVHGMRAQQAIEAVNEYLEKAALAGHMRVRIIHGKGRGILRHAIHQALGDHSLVGTFRDADPDEGGEGVTVVEF